MKIYVVFGTTGEYSDRSEWPVKAFKEEKDAKELILKATEEANKLRNQVGNNQIERWETHDKNPYDSNFRLDYTGTSYYLVEVELE